MTELTLSNGKVSLVDAEDYESLNQHIWTYSRGYAIRCGWDGKKGVLIYLHRYLNQTPKGLHTDHINGDKLDNRKINLRTVTRAQNEVNKPKPKTNTSGYKGVRFRKGMPKKPWYAAMKINQKFIYIGSSETAEGAAKLYDDFASKKFGEYAKLNLTGIA